MAIEENKNNLEIDINAALQERMQNKHDVLMENDDWYRKLIQSNDIKTAQKIYESNNKKLKELDLEVLNKIAKDITPKEAKTFYGIVDVPGKHVDKDIAYAWGNMNIEVLSKAHNQDPSTEYIKESFRKYAEKEDPELVAAYDHALSEKLHTACARAKNEIDVALICRDIISLADKPYLLSDEMKQMTQKASDLLHEYAASQDKDKKIKYGFSAEFYEKFTKQSYTAKDYYEKRKYSIDKKIKEVDQRLARATTKHSQKQPTQISALEKIKAEVIRESELLENWYDERKNDVEELFNAWKNSPLYTQNHSYETDEQCFCDEIMTSLEQNIEKKEKHLEQCKKDYELLRQDKSFSEFASLGPDALASIHKIESATIELNGLKSDLNSLDEWLEQKRELGIVAPEHDKDGISFCGDD